ncbi:MAG: hypothetical protein V1920_07440 [Bacillota bacterium]
MFLFDERYATFEMFSFQHFVAILFFIVLIVLMSIYRNKISLKLDLWLRRLVAVTMITFELTFYIWSISQGDWTFDMLPLGICATSMLFTSYALWTKSEKVFQFIFP